MRRSDLNYNHPPIPDHLWSLAQVVPQGAELRDDYVRKLRRYYADELSDWMSDIARPILRAMWALAPSMDVPRSDRDRSMTMTRANMEGAALRQHLLESYTRTFGRTLTGGQSRQAVDRFSQDL